MPAMLAQRAISRGSAPALMARPWRKQVDMRMEQEQVDPERVDMGVGPAPLAGDGGPVLGPARQGAAAAGGPAGGRLVRGHGTGRRRDLRPAGGLGQLRRRLDGGMVLLHVLQLRGGLWRAVATPRAGSVSGTCVGVQDVH